MQGLYGMGNGGLLGKGLGGGQPYWTPLVQSDFIFTAFGEELGLTGVMALLLLYGLFVQRGLRTAISSRTRTPSCSPAAWPSCWRCRCS